MKKSNNKEEICVYQWNGDTNLNNDVDIYIGKILRTPIRLVDQGNCISFYISVGGNKYVVSNNEVILPDEAIEYLKKHKQIK